MSEETKAGELRSLTTEELAEDAFLKAERLRALRVLNTPTDYDERKQAFIELALAREESAKADLRLAIRIAGASRPE